MEPCRYCEKRPQAPESPLGLCGPCQARPGVRCLYIERKGKPDGWEEHLERLTNRARLRLPLLPRNDPDAPRRPTF